MHRLWSVLYVAFSPTLAHNSVRAKVFPYRRHSVFHISKSFKQTYNHILMDRSPNSFTNFIIKKKRYVTLVVDDDRRPHPGYPVCNYDLGIRRGGYTDNRRGINDFHSIPETIKWN
ncbi:hypothetical protein J6590_016100 [Homalodisca vitripennis]|nr:hypothetical protein J6590_016100 [Homalodisca vitripennis]